MLSSPFDLIPKQYCRHFAIDKGTSLFRQGNNTGGMFYIKSGHIELVRHSAAGELIVIHRANTDSFFAEGSLFSGHYHCDAIARSNTQLIEFDRTYLLNQFECNAQFSIALAKQFTLQLQSARRIREILAIKSARERTLAAIYEGLLVGDLTSFAAIIGLSHEALYRALSALVKSGKLVKLGRGNYALCPVV